MSLRRRLERLERSGCLDFKPAQPRLSKVDLEDLLEGEVVENAHGRFFRRVQYLSLESRYGPHPLRRALGVPAERLVALYQSLEGLELEGALFFDTETTGLAGGSGTYAFLIGLARFEGSRLRLEQLFMRDHQEERAMLYYLGPILEQATGLVSFNGKAYDAQLLLTRFMMNRMRSLLDDMPHLDLLPLSRRIWGPGLDDCRLETLEHEVLGRPRHEDTPGWMIPQIFFRYLRSRDARPLVGVADHNYRDLLAMVGLLGCLAEFVEQPLVARAGLQDFALGKLFDELGESELARELLARSLEGQLPPQARSEAMLRLAKICRREGQRREAVQLWKILLKEDARNIEAAENLAKHLEHQIGDYGWALKLVDATLRSARLSPGRRRSFLDRRARLERRLRQQRVSLADDA